MANNLTTTTTKPNQPTNIMKSPQEIFDIVVNHLLTQNEVCKDPESQDCCYRGPNGLKCAVGVLIDDEHFRISFNYTNMNDEGVKLALEKSGVDINASVHGEITVFGMLAQLQYIHDNFPVNEWRERLKAAKYGLSFNFNLDNPDN